jgi:hypothetical protein
MLSYVLQSDTNGSFVNPITYSTFFITPCSAGFRLRIFPDANQEPVLPLSFLECRYLDNGEGNHLHAWVWRVPS